MNQGSSSIRDRILFVNVHDPKCSAAHPPFAVIPVLGEGGFSWKYSGRDMMPAHL